LGKEAVHLLTTKISKMTFETLYKRTKTGAIQYWKIGVGQHDNGHANIFKESGQLGTDNPTHHLEAVTKGKNIGKANETTPHEQAQLQAESDWKKKLDSGYKTLGQLEELAQQKGIL
jgi:DNA ligase-1